jgi:prolyl-tRNA editing enzyme YbaK/EbsC (Cys-tRNA(Pro) deacylase)
VSAGRRGLQVELAPADLVRLSSAIIADLARSGSDVTQVD